MRGLPAAAYLDSSTAALEHEQIFDRSWQFVCHASDLPAPGTAMRFDLAGRSLAVLRGRDGALRGFLNVCRHRGSRLVDGDPRTGLAFCVDARLRCPYHGWTYDESGALVHVPDAAHFGELDRSAHALDAVCVEQWRGLVFVAFAQPATSLAAALEQFERPGDDAATAALRRLQEPQLHPCGADWKLACEQLLDVSHHAIARPGLKPAVVEAKPFAPCGTSALQLRTTIADTAAAPTWPARAYARSLPASAGRSADLLFVWPNLLLQFLPDALAVLQVLPDATGACVLREVEYGPGSSSRELRLARYARSRVRRRARADDCRIVERVQQGLASGGSGSGGGPIAVHEMGLRWFAERWRACVDLPGPTPRRRASRARSVTTG
jgi:phenylpropionate dioxygenase-like ring-hydroxylating dioxygenase large terminal subunit